MIMTNIDSKKRCRLPAEWETQDAVLLAWPHQATDWNYMLNDVGECYKHIAEAISQHAHLIIVAPDTDPIKQTLRDINQSRISYYDINTNDTWTRDYGAITTIANDGSFIINDFKFNGWGLKFAANHDNLVTRNLFMHGLFNGKYLNRLNFVLEGGSIESNGQDTILTTAKCLLSPNRNGQLSRDQIGNELKQTLGARHILWLENGALEGDDTDSHIDTLARFAPDDTIIYVSCDDPTDSHYEVLEAMRHEILKLRKPDGQAYNTIALPLPNAIFDENGERLPATYANFLIINDAVLMPVYGQQMKDTLAKQIVKIAFPDHQIIPIDCRPLIKQHGSLHCATMQFPKNSINE